MIWLLGTGFFALLFLLMAFSTVRIRLQYHRRNEDDEMAVQVRMWAGLLRFQYRFPTIRLTPKGLDMSENTDTPWPGKKPPWYRRIRWKTIRESQQNFSLLKQRIVDLYDVFYEFLGNVKCERLIWKSHLGTGDAAETGVITGLAWGVKTTLVGVIGSYIGWVVRPHLDVVPHFQERRLETDLDCMIRFRLGHAMLAVFRLLTRIRTKGGEGTWQSTQFKA